MRKSFRSFFISIYIWSFIVVSILPLFILFFIIWIMSAPFDRNHIIPHYYTVIWAWIYLTFNPGWRFKKENVHRINKSKTYILISNHQSLIDVALLMQLRINFKWVSKIELAGVPFIGWVIWLNDHILVKRGDKDSVVRMTEACNRTLVKGISIFMFPEGARTNNGELQEFKEGAFILAKQNNVPILPIVLDGPGNALPKKGFWFKPSQLFTIHIMEEIPVETVHNLELAQLMNYSRNSMLEELKAIRCGK